MVLEGIGIVLCSRLEGSDVRTLSDYESRILCSLLLIGDVTVYLTEV